MNIIVFDKNYKLLDMMWDPIDASANQVGATPVVPHDYMVREYTAKEECIVYLYVSNESPNLVDVYFDDVAMTYTPSRVVQYNEYYPFQNTTQNSWTRVNAVKNNFLGNGGTELNATSNFYDLEYRHYDPVLGRMNGVDPMADKYSSLSPYNFSFNDPVTFNDVNGAEPLCEACYMAEMGLDGISAMNQRPMDPGGGGTYGGYGYAGGGWTANIGGLIINYNSLKDGVHSFNFRNGQLINYTGYDFQTVSSKYGTTYRLTDQYGNNNSDLVYSFGYGSNNYIIHTSQYLSSKYEGSNWNHLKASGMLGIALEMNFRSGKNQIDNMVIVTHGNPQQINFGKYLGELSILSVDDFNSNPEDVSSFNSLLGFIKPGGNLVFATCFPAVILGPAMKGKIRSDVNVYLNGDYTSLGSLFDKNKKPIPGTEHVKFGIPLTDYKLYHNGWINVNSDTQYKNIIINKNGTITMFKK